MLVIEIPGGKSLKLQDLVLDYNGTIAQDGDLIAGIEERFIQLARRLTLHVVTADTHGTAEKKLAHLPCKVEILGPAAQDKQKQDLVKRLGAETTAAVGNGKNDALMLAASGLGIVVCQCEGACIAALSGADVMTNDILDGLDLLLNPLRLIATLRN